MKYILTGCCCLIGLAGIAQSSPIFKGGSGDGTVRLNYVQQSLNFWLGGSGDGHSKNSYIQNSVSFWKGGDGDGYAKANYQQSSINFWKGGDGDGYTKNGYIQNSVNFWKGGGGDGYAKDSVIQNSVSFWKGGKGDGWASVYKPQGALPLTWLSFTAEKWQNKSSRLTWKTSSESNTDRYEIERGTDAVHFVKIATVSAAGNPITEKQYLFDDVSPLKEFNYYRIRQIDVDGHFTYSPARLVRFDEAIENVIRIYPVPATDFINVEIPETMRTENTIINIIAMNGVVVDHVQVVAGSNSLIHFNVAKLARAAYTVHIVSPKANTSTRIILQ